MNIWQAAVMGLVQGLTEFLPVSSSGHLVLAREIMGLEVEPLVFEIVVHVGTLMAVIIVFRKDIWNMITHPLSKPTLYLVLATIPAVVVTLLFDDFIEETFGGSYLGFGFLITATILTLSETLGRHKQGRKFSQMKTTDALAMGGMQAVALFPGISRSGSTIAGGLFAGLDRQLAARFAFLMSVPAILGSLLFKFKDLLAGAEAMGWAPLVTGAVIAAVSGYLAIKYMLYLVRNKKLYGFAVYVAVLGALVLLDQFVFNIVFSNPFA